MDELAEYLVDLRTHTGLTLTNQQASTIAGLWQNLEEFDKNRVVYAARHQDRLLTGALGPPKRRQFSLLVLRAQRDVFWVQAARLFSGLTAAILLRLYL